MRKAGIITLVGALLISHTALAEPSQAQIEMLNKVMAEHAEAEANKPKEPENPWMPMAQHFMAEPSEPRVGMTKLEFTKGRGTPDKKEIIDGKEVWWFDGNEPYYVEFKNNKLVSYYTDKKTIESRAENQKRQQEAYEQAQYEQQARDEYRKREAIRAIGNAFKPQPMPYQVPVNRPVQTNCYNGIGGSVQCTSY
jgi:hypothetical protein